MRVSRRRLASIRVSKIGRSSYTGGNPMANYLLGVWKKRS
jgi:hypothetical protein